MHNAKLTLEQKIISAMPPSLLRKDVLSEIDALRQQTAAPLAPLQAENSRLRQHKIDYMEAAGETSRALHAEIERLKKKLSIYESFPGYLIDHCEGETMYEESLQRWLAEHVAALSKPAGGEKP